MFRCQIGNHSSKTGEKLVRVVLETRNRTYDKTDKNKRGPTFGTEIVSEIRACAACAIGK